MNEIVKIIRANGSADLRIGGGDVTVGFHGSGHEGILTMLGGGYYTVRTEDGRAIEIAKGQLIEVRLKNIPGNPR